MKKVVIWMIASFPYFLSAQFFSGYYESEPQMEGFDHFEIKHRHGDEGRYEGVFSLHAFVEHQEMWEEEAKTIYGEEADALIEKYGNGLDILSVHKLKIMWDGLEWEFFMLGYLDKRDHGQFIVIEEIFADESESELLEVRKYIWEKAHHLSLRNLVKHN